MRKRCIVWVLCLTWWLSLAGCTSQGGNAKEGKAGGKPVLAVETADLQVADMSQGVDVVGTLQPKREASVKSEYLGMVTEVFVTEWVHVKKGMPLAKLDTREADALIKKLEASIELARANLLEAEAAKSRAEREYERSRNLKEYGLITQQNLEDGETARTAAQARVSAAQAQLRAAEEDLRQGETRLAKAVIRAPMDGVVAACPVQVGDLVGEVGTPTVMFTIVDNRLLELVANVPSHATALLKVGQPLLFTTDAVPGKEFRGRVKFINPTVNPSDRSVKVIAEVANVPEVLKGGLFVQGRIITRERKGVPQVPRTSLVSWDITGQKGEVLVAERGAARLRQVRTGIASGDMVEITGGLAAGEKIITRGGFTVKDGDAVQTAGSAGGK